MSNRIILKIIRTRAGGTLKMTAGQTRDWKWVLEMGGMFLLLSVILGLLFHGVWLPGHTLFSNDGPLGRLISDWHHLPERFTGCWADLNGIGFSGGIAPPGISLGLQYLFGPVLFSKLYAFAALMILGLGAWCFFSQMGLAPLAARLGGLAAALNSCFFSVACWGVAAQTITAGVTFFALAALADRKSRWCWWRVALAGFAVGLGVVDGADVGAIFSLLVAAFVAWQAWIGGGPASTRLVKGSLRLVVVVLFAGWIAAQAISSLVGTSIKGMVERDANVAEPITDVRQAHWDWATQWSLPVRETVSLIVPGVFGYRMDSNNGGKYWGAIGQDPVVTRYLENGRQGPAPVGFLRSAGSGFYAGVPVVLIGVWALVQSFRRKDPLYSPSQCKWLWFWLAVTVVSLLLSYGRFAPFYQLLYALPGFSNIRNPTKFIYLISFALVVLFAYGMDGLHRKHMSAVNARLPGWPGFKAFFAKIERPERSWLWGCVIALGIALLAWLEYASSREDLVTYLQSMQFSDNADEVADFSLRQVGWFVLFFALSILAMAGILGGAFGGAKARWGGVIIGLLLAIDLGRANLPWIVVWDYQDKYASNPIIERLREKPYEHRVTCLGDAVSGDVPDLSMLYNREWVQQQFPYYNIQTLDIVDMPRKPADYVAYVSGPKPAAGASGQSYLQIWRLTNTRYVLGPAADESALARSLGQSNDLFRVVERFNLVPRSATDNPGEWDSWTPQPDDHGTFALYDYTDALPRVMLFSNWQVETNDAANLAQLYDPGFNPHQRVLVSETLPAAMRPSPQPPPGTVDFVRYAPKDIVLKSDAPAASVLLLNDHYDPDWKVLVDGRPEPLLRCNYIMRGVCLLAGAHTIEFRYQPRTGLFYISLAAIGLSLGVLVMVVLGGTGQSTAPVRLLPKPAVEPSKSWGGVPVGFSGPPRGPARKQRRSACRSAANFGSRQNNTRLPPSRY